MTICCIQECSSPHLAKGLCSKHYYRYKRGQSLVAPTRFTRRRAVIEGDIAKIPLGREAKQGHTIVDKENAHLDKYNWLLSVRGYPVAYINGEMVLLHHIIMGKPPVGMVTDHRNRNTLDNTYSNLRFITQHINCINKSKQSNNTSGHTGVVWEKRRQKWAAQIVLNRKNNFLGYFEKLEDAVAARKVAESKLSEYREAFNIKKENHR